MSSSSLTIQLNLPQAELKLRKENDFQQVFDPIRKKWVALTPEERVRQTFIGWLIKDRKYPSGRFANEISLNLNGHRRRCDTVVYDASAKPIAIIEYKSPEVAITKHTFDQIGRYNLVLSTPFLIVSNGLTHYCCLITEKGYRFLNDIPSYEDLLKSVTSF